MIPEPGAQCFVNGKPVVSSEVLHTGSRVILGKYHVFRYNDPIEARQSRQNLTTLMPSKFWLFTLPNNFITCCNLKKKIFLIQI